MPLATLFNLSWYGPASIAVNETAVQAPSIDIKGTGRLELDEEATSSIVSAKLTALKGIIVDETAQSVVVSADLRGRARVSMTADVAAQPTAFDIAQAVFSQQLAAFSDEDSAGFYIKSGGGAGSGGMDASGTATSLIKVYEGTVSGTLTNFPSPNPASLPANFSPLRLYLRADWVSGSGNTLEVKFQHSIDTLPTHWITYGTFELVNTLDADKELAVSSPLFEFARILISTTGTDPVYTLTVYVAGSLK